MDPKRKTDGTSVTVEENYNDRDKKRIKTSDFLPQYGETPEETTGAGLELLDLLKNCRDENGRDAAAAFRTLPSLRGNEVYYAKIKAPIALNTVERRLKNREFASLTQLESYLKRLIQNFKETSARDELLHCDAERLRKLIASWMQTRNPAYSDPEADYVPLPTPLTDEFIAQHPSPSYLPGQRYYPAKTASYQHDGAGDSDVDMQDAYGEGDEQQTCTSTSVTPNPETPAPGKKRPGRPPKNPSRRASSTPAPGPRIGGGFNGLTFQQAQEKIVEEMMQEKETADDDWPKYDPFVRLPPRSLRDYYAVIPHPVSLNTLKKNVRGPGHNEITKYETWDDFEEEVSLLWKNAHHYNEDGSAISELASELEIFFNKRVAAAKKAVEQPSKQKIKLKLSAPAQAQEPVSTPRNSLRMVVKDNSGSSSAPVPASVATLMSASSPSQAAARQSPQMTMAPPSISGPADRRSSLTRASPKPVGSATPLKQEVKASPALPPTISAPPALQAVPPILNPTQSNGNSMAPPIAMDPSVSFNGTQPNGVVMNRDYSQPAPAAAPSYDHKWRMPGKSAADALISKIYINTHPGLNLRKHFRMEILADDNLAQQSYTITLPADHYWLQITPTLNASLAQRHHKSFGIASNVRLTPFPPLPGQAVDRLAPLYEHRLKPGVNVLEFEVIAAAPEGSKPANAQHVEFEKITILANLQKPWIS